eukprot:2423738-Rhodomonas_salina.1
MGRGTGGCYTGRDAATGELTARRNLFQKVGPCCLLCCSACGGAVAQCEAGGARLLLTYPQYFR